MALCAIILGTGFSGCAGAPQEQAEDQRARHRAIVVPQRPGYVYIMSFATAVDGHRLHVAWLEDDQREVNQSTGCSVWHASSDDGGRSWTVPVSVGRSYGIHVTVAACQDTVAIMTSSLDCFVSTSAGHSWTASESSLPSQDFGFGTIGIACDSGELVIGKLAQPKLFESVHDGILVGHARLGEGDSLNIAWKQRRLEPSVIGSPRGPLIERDSLSWVITTGIRDDGRGSGIVHQMAIVRGSTASLDDFELVPLDRVRFASPPSVRTTEVAVTTGAATATVGLFGRESTCVARGAPAIQEAMGYGGTPGTRYGLGGWWCPRIAVMDRRPTTTVAWIDGSLRWKLKETENPVAGMFLRITGLGGYHATNALMVAECRTVTSGGEERLTVGPAVNVAPDSALVSGVALLQAPDAIVAIWSGRWPVGRAPGSYDIGDGIYALRLP